MAVSRSRRRQASREAWRAYLPILDCALASRWKEFSGHMREQDFSLDAFIGFLTEHDLGITLHWLIKRDSASAWVPSALILHLMGITAYGSGRRQDLSEALQEISTRATESGIPIMILKGMHFARRFYGAQDARWARDLDLMVDVADQAAMCSIMRDMAYQPEGLEWLPVKITNSLQHATSWQRGDVSVDLHHDFRVRPGYHIDSKSIFADGHRETIAGLKFFVPSDEDSLFLLMVSIVSDIEQARISAKSLVDFQIMMSQLAGQLDWDGWLAGRKEEGLYHLVVASMQLLKVALPRSVQFPVPIYSPDKQFEPMPSARMEKAITLLSAPNYSLANRRWFLKYYRGGKFSYFSWWLLGGLFRPGSVARLGRSLLPS